MDVQGTSEGKLMSDIYPNEGRGRAVLGILIAFGLIVGGWALGAEIKAPGLATATSL